MFIESVQDTVILDGKQVKTEAVKAAADGDRWIYEVVRIKNGKPVFLKAHLERMNHSLHLTGAEHRLDVPQVAAVIEALRAQCGVLNQNIKLLGWFENEVFHWGAYFVESHYPSLETYNAGVAVGLYQETRENPNAKVWNGSLKETVKAICEETGWFEVLLVDEAGYITEGSRSNLFFVRGNSLITAASHQVLEGITRKMLVEVLESMPITVQQRRIHKDELPLFEGAFLTGTSIHVLPIHSIDGVVIQTETNPLVSRIREAFEAYVQKSIQGDSYAVD